MANFPGNLASFIGFIAGNTLKVDVHAAQHNLEQGEILAVQTKVGTGASTPINNTVLRGNGTGTSQWSQVALTTDVTGVLPVANGGTGQSSLTSLVVPSAVLANPAISGTVTGNATYSTPILTQPTIADFTNAIHTHISNATGGQLNAANAISAGTVNFANLLSSIFSGQVLTQANAGTAGGTMSYVNLGGIKLLWCTSANQTTGAAGNNYTFTLPSFFSTITTTIATAALMTTLAQQYAAVSSQNTTTITIQLVSPGGAATAAANILVIGT